VTRHLASGPGTGCARGAATSGASARLTDARARIASGPNAFDIRGVRGLDDSTSRKTCDRVRDAVLNSWIPWPGHAVTVRLVPASPPALGASLDLAIAVAVLAAAGPVPPGTTEACLLLAALDPAGGLHPVPGVRAAVAAAAGSGCTQAVVAAENAAEAAEIPGIVVINCRSLRAVLARLHEALPGQPGVPVTTPALLSRS
jgi:magnesium chelatase family protein